jgi:ABC-type dipeptide/oligopeptide/nickel transport system permease subunit
MAVAEITEIHPELEGARGPQRGRTLRILVRKKLVMLAVAYLLVFYACGIFAPLIAPHSPTKQELTVEARSAGPTADHWFGRDSLGRDVLSRVLYSARTTILFTLAVLLTGGLFLGLGLGLLAGYKGGWVDTAVMRVGEILAGLPTLLLMLAITASFRTQINDFAFRLADNSWLSVDDARTFVKFVIIVGATVPFAWVGSARIVRSVALSIREQAYVTAAEAMGASTPRILFRHILPGVMPLFIVGLSAGMAAIAGAEVAISYLGLGIDEPAASFGNLLNDVQSPYTFRQHPHLLLAPAIPVILFFYAWNLLGDALVDILEPRTTRL